MGSYESAGESFGDFLTAAFTFGAVGKGGYLADTDQDDSKQPQPQQVTQTTQQAQAPEAPQADLARDLIAQQGARRRRFLLQQSTGRPPQGPSLTTTQTTPTRSLLG